MRCRFTSQYVLVLAERVFPEFVQFTNAPDHPLWHLVILKRSCHTDYTGCRRAEMPTLTEYKEGAQLLEKSLYSQY